MSRSSYWVMATVLLCAVACAAMWGFTIDDALISIRYAQNLHAGNGWRFASDGPPTDGVTPLPWPLVILPLAGADALTVLDRVRVLGVVVHLAAIAVLGLRIERVSAPRIWKIAGIAAIALALPVSAHASSGMETALVMALATCAVSVDRPWAAPVFAGLAASLRPEMIPWTIAIASGLAIAQKGASRRSIAISVGGALAPTLAVVIVRLVVFGRPAPLSVLAKPSDLGQGFAYAIAAIVACAIPVLVMAPFALKKEKGPALAIAIAALVHVLAIVAAGGDWMPYARLLAPIAPGLALAFVLSSPHARTWSLMVRSAIVLLVGARMWIVAAPLGRHVDRDRRALIERARPELASAKRIATVDIGWTSAATNAPILDLAGLTDPSIAILPGSHTSKRVDAAMLLDRDVDVLLLYLDHDRYTRFIEGHLAASSVIEEHFETSGFLPLGETSEKGYLVLRKIR